MSAPEWFKPWEQWVLSRPDLKPEQVFAGIRQLMSQYHATQVRAS